MSLRKPRSLSRRAVLRGAGVALTLPWLESLEPRAARAEAVLEQPRFLPIFLPNGAPELWRPQATGSAAGWALSSVLEPLAALKSKVTVVSGLENGSVFNPDGGSSVEPSHGRLPGAWLTCADAMALRQQLGVDDANGVSFDQILASYAPAVGAAPLASLQVGLSSFKSFCDGEPCSLSRSVSWKTQTEPAGKLVNPKDVFDQLIGATPQDQVVSDRATRAVHGSVLDAVQQSALTLRGRLGSYDQLRLDEYLQAVRDVEQRATTTPVIQNCDAASNASFPDYGSELNFMRDSAAYSKGAHADLMADLLVLAFQCNLTRIVSYMLEDERSDYVYDFLPCRTFTAQGSTPSTGVCGAYQSVQHGITDQFATITWWNVGKVSKLCQRLDAIIEPNGKTVLDNSIVFLGGCMHGSDHQADRLPAVLIGGGAGALKTDQHVDLSKRPLRDLYYTLAKRAYGLDLPDFGVNRTGAPPSIIAELVAS